MTITTLQDPPCDMDYLRLRAVECGDCLEWVATTSKEGYPVLTRYLPQPGQPNKLQKQFYVRHLVYWIKHGKPPPADRRFSIVATCRNKLCIAPDHVERWSKSRINKQSRAKGAWQSAAFGAKVAINRRRHSHLSDEGVARIRSHEGALRDLAAELQISLAYAYMIRRGKNRRDYSNPFSQLLATAGAP